jgi:hypothetical protein
VNESGEGNEVNQREAPTHWRTQKKRQIRTGNERVRAKSTYFLESATGEECQVKERSR